MSQQEQTPNSDATTTEASSSNGGHQQRQPRGPVKVHNPRTSELLKKVFSLNNAEKAIKAFHCIDPFNKSNTIRGYLVMKHGKFNGSMIIDHINGVDLEKPNIVYNIPNLNYLYPKKQKKQKGISFLPESHFKSLKGLHWYCFMKKWNGSNIVLYKYRNNEGQQFVSAKTKGTPIVENNDRHSIKFLDLTIRSLKKLNLFHNETIQAMLPSDSNYFTKFIEDTTINALSCELCGSDEPHLVRYDFDIELKPLLYLHENGSIEPCISMPQQAVDAIDAASPVQINHLYPYDGKTSDGYKELIHRVQELQAYNLGLNEKFRTDNGLSHQYEYNHFITEGNVLYLLNDKNQCVDRNLIYKIKPTDVEEVHWETFGDKHKKLVDEALHKIDLRQLELTEENVKRELDTIGDKGWGKFGSQIMQYVREKTKDGDDQNEKKRKHQLAEEDEDEAHDEAEEQALLEGSQKKTKLQ